MNQWETALLAFNNDDADLFNSLLKNNAELKHSHSEDDGHSLLHHASKKNAAACVTMLLSQECDIETKGNAGETALHLACKYCASDVFLKLIEYGANPNAATLAGTTPLIWACSNENNVSTSIVQSLIDAGADVNIQSSDGASVLHWACRNNLEDVFATILKAGANVNTADNFGRQPLHCTMKKGSVSITQKLLAAGADVDKPDEDGITPLHWGVIFHHYEVVKLLLAVMANPDKPANNGLTALQIATEDGCSDLIQVLTSPSDEGGCVESLVHPYLFVNDGVDLHTKPERFSAETPPHEKQIRALQEEIRIKDNLLLDADVEIQEMRRLLSQSFGHIHTELKYRADCRGYRLPIKDEPSKASETVGHIVHGQVISVHREIYHGFQKLADKSGYVYMNMNNVIWHPVDPSAPSAPNYNSTYSSLYNNIPAECLKSVARNPVYETLEKRGRQILSYRGRSKSALSSENGLTSNTTSIPYDDSNDATKSDALSWGVYEGN